MLDADPPRTFAVLPQRNYISPDIDQRMMDASQVKYGCRPIQCITLGIAAQIELHRLVVAKNRNPSQSPFIRGGIRRTYHQIAHLRVACHPLRDERFIRLHGLELVGMKSPHLHQPADSRIEQALRLF